MFSYVTISLAILSLLTRDLLCEGAKILAVFAYPSKSHSVVFNTVTLELAQRGHELVVVTGDPIKDDLPSNYVQIDTSSLYEVKSGLTINSMGTNDFWVMLSAFEDLAANIVDRLYAHPNMASLIAPNTTTTFDLVIVEWVLWWGMASLAHKFSAPLIGINSINFPANSYYTVGNPLNAAYTPDIAVGYTDKMNMWQRFENLYSKANQLWRLEKQLERQDAITRKYLGNEIPHLRDIVQNVSIVLECTNPIVFYPEPTVPTIVEISGIHLTEEYKKVKLPEDMTSFLDGAHDGFIYFSLGTTIRGSKMSDWTRSQFLEAFAELPYRVLWKWENNTLPGKPSNVLISKWLPQRQILAHPNIKVFMYQGGLQSTEETIHNAVPVVGIPLLADQTSNVRKMESSGLGKGIYTNIESIKKEEVKAALLEVIEDPGYKERIKTFRELRNDRPQNVLEKAVWWIEHVIKHKGARHLRVRAMDLSWYQIHCVDLAVVAMLLLMFTGVVLYYATRCIVSTLTATMTGRYKLKAN